MVSTFKEVFKLLNGVLAVRYLIYFVSLLVLYEGMQIGVSYLPSITAEIAKNKIAPSQEILYFGALAVYYTLLGYLDSGIDILVVKNHLIKVFNHTSLRNFHQITGLDEQWHHKNDSGALAAKVNKGVYKLLDLLMMSSWEFIPSSIQFLLSLIPLAIFAPKTIPVVTIALVSFVLLTIKAHRRVKSIRKQVHDLEELANSKFIQAVQGLKDLQSNNGMDSFAKSYQESLDKLKHLDTKEAKIIILTYSRSRLAVVYAANLAILALMFLDLKSGQINEGVFYGTLVVTSRLFTSITRIARIFDNVEKASEGISRVASIHNEEPKIKDGLLDIIPQGDIQINNICFGYGDGNLVLNNLTLPLPVGRTTALVGPSGSGKTTIAKLIQRHYDPSNGEILFGHNNLKDLKVKNLRSVIPVVSQDPYIFNLSIRDNITLGNEVDEETLIQVAINSHLHDFVLEKGGYETLVGERGLKLSGGQRQRLGIARALLRTTVLKRQGYTPIVILDEPTSALDAGTENIIMDGIKELQQTGATVIIIAHRLATIQHADQIAVLDKGQLLELGNHQQLISKGGMYADLVKKQTLNGVE